MAKSWNRHGQSGTPVYNSWAQMKDRCYNPNNGMYKHYGGRGIGVCSRWRDSFANFYYDMGDRPEDRTIDRIDNDKPYSPENCRWATQTQQQSNRSTNVVLEHDGLKMTMKEWAAKVGLPYTTLQSRITKLGWSAKKALTVPYLGKGISYHDYQKNL